MIENRPARNRAGRSTGGTSESQPACANGAMLALDSCGTRAASATSRFRTANESESGLGGLLSGSLLGGSLFRSGVLSGRFLGRSLFRGGVLGGRFLSGRLFRWAVT